MTFNCNECQFLLEWPENWVKGNRPIESELKKEHTRERCQEIKNNGRKIKNKICECLKRGFGICMKCGGTTCSYLGCYIENHNCKNSRWSRV